MSKSDTPAAVRSNAELGPWSMPHHPEPYMTWTTSEVACVLAFVRREVAAERESCADALRCALEALDYCIEDSAELLNERTVQWGSWRKDRQAAMAATLERHRAVAERLRAILRA